MDVSFGNFHPELLVEWSDENTINPFDYSPKSGKRVLWKCSKNTEHPNWYASIYSRAILKAQCPYCNNRRFCRETSLGYCHPHLIKEWSSKNTKTPFEYSQAAGIKVWWKCSENDEHPEWEAFISNRSKHGKGCPYCKNKLVCKVNSLAYLNPGLAEQWSSKNIKTPWDYTAGSNKKVWWKCSEDKKHPEWETAIVYRTSNKNGCPYCSGRCAYSENNFAKSRPELVCEWSSRNKTRPEDHTPNSGSRIWWRCSKNPDHPEWECTVDGRSKTGCPYCSNKKICAVNNLGYLRPEFIDEWSERNKKTIYEYAEFSNAVVWWRCIKDSSHPEWKSAIANRTSKSKTGCPMCVNFSRSKGEDAVAKYLDEKGYEYITQKKFKGDDIIEIVMGYGECKHVRHLPFDFYTYIPIDEVDNTVVVKGILIEYQGKQHYESVSVFGGEDEFGRTQMRDGIKREFASKHGIPLLEIRYDDNIEEVLDAFISSLRKK